MDDISTLSTFGELLKAFRKQRKITQQALATQLSVHRNTIGTWENGEFLPDSKAVVLELARLLHLDTRDTRRLLEASLTALSPHWQVPYQRNPFFTGRTSVLQQLHGALAHEHSAVISQSYALSGLGGIGKTQTAIEYAYRYANDYAAVFWVSAETNESIISSFLAIAELLNLPEKQDKDQSRVTAAVTRWLTSHSDWLLIFDNVEDLELVKGVLPPARRGSLLFTSRRQALGFSAHTLDLEQMTPEEGVRFLLHRARLLDPNASLDALDPEDMDIAREIVAVMDGLPLALDQAGAYIEETQCGLSEYLRLFQSARLRLLDERNAHADHPSSVTRTFALAFEQLERVNPAAAELLTVCAFLAPEAIPEMFFIEGAAHLGPTFEKLAADPFAFQIAIKALLAYSLIQRNAAAKTVTIHRLVQVVLRERLTEEVQGIWGEHVISAMVKLFPGEEMQVNYWQACERLIQHGMACVGLVEKKNLMTVEAASLLYDVGLYLHGCGRYNEAQLLLTRTLAIREAQLKHEHPDIAESLTLLASIYRAQGEYKKAELLSKRALAIRELLLGFEHPETARSLNNLAELYRVQGKYAKAEILAKRALIIHEQQLGPEHSSTARSLNNLALIYRAQGKYEQAEILYQQALSIYEKVLGLENPDTSQCIHNLAVLYFYQEKYEQGESLQKRAFALREQQLGPEHPDTIQSLNSLAAAYRRQGKYEQAEPLYQQALVIREHQLGANHPNVAYPLCGLAELYREQGKYEQAKPLYQQILRILEQDVGSTHPLVAHALQGLATIYKDQEKYEQANLLYQRALTLRQQHLGPMHPDVADSLHQLAYLYQLQQHTTEAISFYQQALTIREKALGPHHPKTNATRTAYTHLLRELGREEEAQALEKDVLEDVVKP